MVVYYMMQTIKYRDWVREATEHSAAGNAIHYSAGASLFDGDGLDWIFKVAGWNTDKTLSELDESSSSDTFVDETLKSIKQLALDGRVAHSVLEDNRTTGYPFD